MIKFLVLLLGCGAAGKASDISMVPLIGNMVALDARLMNVVMAIFLSCPIIAGRLLILQTLL